MKRWMTSTALILALCGNAQDTTVNKQPSLTISGYVEAYYSYDFNRPADHNRPGFLYNHNRHNEFNANLAFVKASYNTEKLRANLSIGTGTYMNANYAAENGVLKNIYEANAGIKLSRSKNLWLDIGIMPSHIGFESAVSKDCWALTRSLVAENSPYFESGAKLSYTTGNGKLSVSALALNGWQRITRLSGNSLMSWGTQVAWKPTDKITLNYSTFAGTDKPDSTRRWRIYHNLYGIVQFSDKWGLTAGFDLGTEQAAKGSRDKNVWYTPVAILRFTPVSEWAIALRGEYFHDEEEVIVSTGAAGGFRTSGMSVNIDYLAIPQVALRLEGRLLRSQDKIFLKNDTPGKNAAAITFSAAVNF